MGNPFKKAFNFVTNNDGIVDDIYRVLKKEEGKHIHLPSQIIEKNIKVILVL